MPRLLRFLLLHAVVGFTLATLFIIALLWADPGGVAQVLRRAPGHPWPVLLLWFFSGLTFGSVQIGVATMLLEERPEQPPQDPPGGLRVPVAIPVKR